MLHKSHNFTYAQLKLAAHLTNHGVPTNQTMNTVLEIEEACVRYIRLMDILRDLRLLRDPYVQRVLDKYRAVSQPKPYTGLYSFRNFAEPGGKKKRPAKVLAPLYIPRTTGIAPAAPVPVQHGKYRSR